MPSLVGQMLDHYHLRERIGKGGMSTVYRGVDTKQLREVAIKVLSPAMVGDKRFLMLFRREAGLVKQKLQHPHIVPVLDYGQSRGFVYLVMPFISGETLADRLSRGKLTLEENAQWVSQVADALSFAHGMGIIHRDIKPSNVLISENGDAMLTDFGLAREVDRSTTLTRSMLMGTPAFISPEQGRGKRLDARSDQYSLGVILYLIAAGRLPFGEEAPMAAVIAHIKEAVPRPRRFNHDLSPNVERVILKSLAKRQDERFESVAVLNGAYQAAMAGQDIPRFEMPSEMSTAAKEARKSFAHTRPVTREVQVTPRRSTTRWILLLMLLIVVTLGAFILTEPSRLGLAGFTSPSEIQLTETAASAVTNISPPTQPLATLTSAPIQAAPVTSEACPGIELSFLSKEGSDVKWLLDNGTDVPIRLQQMPDISWNRVRGPLNAVRLGDEIIWEGELGLGDFESGDAVKMSESPNQIISSHQAAILSLTFKYANLAEEGFKLDLALDVGCTLSGDWGADL